MTGSRVVIAGLSLRHAAPGRLDRSQARGGPGSWIRLAIGGHGFTVGEGVGWGEDGGGGEGSGSGASRPHCSIWRSRSRTVLSRAPHCDFGISVGEKL